MSKTPLIAGLALLAASSVALADVDPIRNVGPTAGVKTFIGKTATPNPIAARTIPQNPFMTENGRSGLHLDSYMSDVYTIGGPLGKRRKLSVSSTALDSECGTVTFDEQGRIITACVSFGINRLLLLDPDTLETLASQELPLRPVSDLFGAGGYFYLDHRDRTIIPTTDNDIRMFKVIDTETSPSFKLVKKCDVSSAVARANEINSVLPAGPGKLWFLTTGGVVGLVDMASCTFKTRQLKTPDGTKEPVVKSFAVEPATFDAIIVTNYALYRITENANGRPKIAWRTEYDRGTRIKPGQVVQGSGTTPTLIGDKWVAISDNADPFMHVNVYDRTDGSLVCQKAVFRKLPRRNANFNSLIGFKWKDRERASIIIENNYGNRTVSSTFFGRTTKPGIARIDVHFLTKRCRLVWENYTISIPSVVSQLSLETGLIYTYTKPRGPGRASPWYFTGVDFETGKTMFRRLTGTGLGYNNYYSGVYLSPAGVAYVGVLGGIVRIDEAD